MKNIMQINSILHMLYFLSKPSFMIIALPVSGAIVLFCFIINPPCGSSSSVNVAVGDIFHYRSLEPFNTAVERYATSLCVHDFPKKTAKAPSCYVQSAKKQWQI